MSPAETLLLLLAASMAGAMNAVAGGGTILTFPALLAFGMPAIQANATSTFALLAGIVGSAFAYRRHLSAVKTSIVAFVPISLLGGLGGAWLLTQTSEKLFSALVPYLLLFATILFMMQGAVRQWVGSPSKPPHGETPGPPNSRPALLLAHPGMALAQLGVAIYGGYFGAGIGILMLAVLGITGFTNIHEMNALKTILAAAINLVAAVYFVFAGLVIWPQALLMTVGATGGYFLGAHYAQKIPERRVRQLVAAIGIVITLSLFLR